jgi:hypothetical protein
MPFSQSFVAPRSVFTAPTSTVGSMLQTALRTTPFRASPPATSSFFTKAPALLPSASSIVAGWRPATPATVPPQPAPPAASSSVGGLFARIAKFSQPSLPPSALQFAKQPAPAATGFDAAPVSAGWRSVGGVTPSLPPAFVGTPPPAASMIPPAQPPAGQAATLAPQASPTSTLPDPGFTMGPGGSFPGSGDGAYLNPPSSAAPTAAPDTSPSLGTLALYGGVAVGGLFLLSKMFKGGGRGEA